VSEVEGVSASEYSEAQEYNQEQELDNNEPLKSVFVHLNFLKVTSSSLPYINCRIGDREMIKMLIDTGSNKNYINPKYPTNPKKKN